MKALINKFFSKKEEILRNDSIDEETDTREGISKQDRDFDEDI